LIKMKVILSLVTPRGIICSPNCDFFFDAECLPAEFHWFAFQQFIWCSPKPVASVGSLLEVTEVETTVSYTMTQYSIRISI
jgi:hypothetical protein